MASRRGLAQGGGCRDGGGCRAQQVAGGVGEDRSLDGRKEGRWNKQAARREEGKKREEEGDLMDGWIVCLAAPVPAQDKSEQRRAKQSTAQHGKQERKGSKQASNQCYLASKQAVGGQASKQASKQAGRVAGRQAAGEQRSCRRASGVSLASESGQDRTGRARAKTQKHTARKVNLDVDGKPNE